MAPSLTIVIPVWDAHARLLPRCLQAIRTEPVAADLVIVDNASDVTFEIPPEARRITLTERQSTGAARNAGLAHVSTPFVVFADADDEIVPGSLAGSLSLLRRQPGALGVLGRSLVDERGRYRRGITPRPSFRLASQYLPGLTSLFWLAAFQGSITSTVLRTESVREAGGFADTNMAEDWHLAARLARRGPLICRAEPIRLYHRHPAAARNTGPHQPMQTLLQAIWADCLHDPRAGATHRALARILLRATLRRRRLRDRPRTPISSRPHGSSST